MNILITGANGFIGKKIACSLLNKHKVLILDQNPFNEEMSNKFSTYVFDISCFENFSQITEDIDVIIHCAAQSGGYRGLIEPELDCDWNCKGTLNVVNFARYKNVHKIIYTSSMAVYGDGSYISEEQPPNPLSNYGVSKLTGEFYIRTLKQDDIKFTIFRLFNTYGFGQDMQNLRQGMLSIYLSQALNNKKIEVTGSLQRIRDFIHVDDVVAAINIALTNSSTNNNTFNVCSGRETKVEELLNMIQNLFNENVPIIELKGYSGDQFGNSGDNTKLKSLGWKPKISLEEGLKEFYEQEINSYHSC